MFQLLWSDPKKVSISSLFSDKKNLKKYNIEKTSFLLWEEHCVECAPLESSSTCLHPKRKDNQCASFSNGIEENYNIKGIEGFGAEIEFTKWAKLETQWSFFPKMYSQKKYKVLYLLLNFLQKFSKKTNNVFNFVPKSYYLCKIITSFYNRIFPYLSIEKKEIVDVDGFLVEFYVPEIIDDGLVFEIIKKNKPIFKHRLNFKFGWNQEFIPYNKFSDESKEVGLFRIWVESQKKTKIIFKTLNLVKLNNIDERIKVSKKINSTEKIKCVIFDLDNTLWNGIVGDDGDQIIINNDTVDFIKSLDSKGIICSIASKNDYNTAWSMIEKFGLTDYFLFAKINWGLKSESIKKIAREMNVNIDTFAFIDDSLFEREQVKSVLPQVRTYDVKNINELINLPEFDVPVNSQSKSRKKSYLQNIERDNFEEFLINCKMQMSILNSFDNFDRCHELILRTNQFNISGKKFTKDEFKEILKIEKSMCWEVKDKFGNYGIVGFLTFVESDNEVLINNFVLSCRVAEKKVEETLFDWLQKQNMTKDIKIKFVKTEKNKPIKEKLENMELLKEENKEYDIYKVNKKNNLLKKKIIEIISINY